MWDPPQLFYLQGSPCAGGHFWQTESDITSTTVIALISTLTYAIAFHLPRHASDINDPEFVFSPKEIHLWETTGWCRHQLTAERQVWNTKQESKNRVFQSVQYYWICVLREQEQKGANATVHTFFVRAFAPVFRSLFILKSIYFR
jgi:nicotinamide riboside transporter PnuC